jgi:hypothetical protein
LVWVELFALVNLAGIAPDIYLAHSVNYFHHAAEYVPLYFSILAPILLLPAFWALATGRSGLWRGLGNIVGWASVLVGVTGMVLHLKSQFFQQQTLASLVYAAPFAAPLAYTGIGLLLIMDRMVREDEKDWALWVVFLALGGFVGNFLFSVTDHAQNGFYHWTEWIPVVSSALAVGFLVVPLLIQVSLRYLLLCTAIMILQAGVGIVGFFLHVRANLHASGPTLFDRFVFGAPAFAPMLFPDLVMLALIGLWALYQYLRNPSTPRAAEL